MYWLYFNPISFFTGIVDYSNDTNDIAAVNGIGGNGGGGNSLHSGDLNSSSNDGDDDDCRFRSTLNIVCWSFETDNVDVGIGVETYLSMIEIDFLRILTMIME